MSGKDPLNQGAAGNDRVLISTEAAEVDTREENLGISFCTRLANWV